jgi:hypothetical protein
MGREIESHQGGRFLQKKMFGSRWHGSVAQWSSGLPKK